MHPAATILAATSSPNRATIFQLGVAVTALVFSLVVAALTGLVEALRREPRIEPGPRTLDTPPQSPAVAALLTHTREVPGEAAAATVVDLAARNVVEIFDMGGGAPGIRIRTAAPSGQALTPYETRVVELIRAHVDSSGVTPGSALALIDEKTADTWLHDFRDEVRTEAHAAGWVRRRYGREVLVLSALLVGGWVALTTWGLMTATRVPTYSRVVVPQRDLRNEVTFAALVAGGLALFLIGRLGVSAAQRLTTSGRELASKWLGVAEHLRADEQLAEAPPTAVAIWDRLLAYATAFGVAHRVQDALPLGPESATSAWSSVTGRWRLVRVSYPEHWPPGWGSRPSELLKSGLGNLVKVAVPLFAIITIGRQLLEGGWLHHVHVPLIGYAIAALVVGGFFAVAIGALLSTLIGAGQLFGAFAQGRELTGRAVRVRRRTRGGTWVAIDDGSSDELRAVAIRDPKLTVAQGDDVRVTVRPWTGEVTSIAPVAAAVKPSASATA